MTTYADLAPLDYFGQDGANCLVAIGWLGKDTPYVRGELPEQEVIEKLIRHVQKPWQPPMACAGFHTCELCRLTDALLKMEHRNEHVATCSSNVFIPGHGKIYCAPTMILHYLNAHEYAPPTEFWDAIRDGPEPGTMAFKQAFLANGGRAWIRSFDWLGTHWKGGFSE